MSSPYPSRIKSRDDMRIDWDVRVAKDIYIESFRRRFPDHRASASPPLTEYEIQVDRKLKPTP